MNPFGDHEHEPVVRSEELRELVDLARNRPTPRVGVELESITRALAEHRRHHRYRMLAVACAAVFSIGLAALWSERPPASETQSRNGAANTDVLAVHHDHDASRAGVHDNAGELPDGSDGRAQPGPGPRPVTHAPALAGLPDEVTVRSLADEQAVPEVLNDWEVAVAAGRYVVELDAKAKRTLTVRVGDRLLEVEPGARLELDAGDERFSLQRGRARWKQPKQGKRGGRSATQLARLADAKMAAGEASAARAVLERLVRRYPGHPVSRTALLDLARLERAAGRDDRARCAYRLYRDRYGASALARELDEALAELGDGPKCRGLRPHRR